MQLCCELVFGDSWEKSKRNERDLLYVTLVSVFKSSAMYGVNS